MHWNAPLVSRLFRYGVLLPTLALMAHMPLRAQDRSSATTQISVSKDGAQSTYTLTVQSQIVQLDVTVRDTKGRLVTGLHRDDFTVLEDNIPQKIVSFQANAPASGFGGHVTQIDSTAQLDKREPDAPVTIVVLDELTTNFAGEYFARYSLERYLAKQGAILDQPTMLIARTVDRTMVLCDYTTSRKKVLDALNRHLVGNDWRNNNPNFQDVQIGAAFASLIEIAKATQGHPGHKNLIWIGRGFPTLQWSDLHANQADKLQQVVSKCVDLLREARITLYEIDPAGVSVNDGAMDATGVVAIDDPFNGAIDFDSMAKMTGGMAMHGRNDVDHLIGDAIANGETFYTLTYRPAFPVDNDPKKYRSIKVTLKDPTLVAMNRQGYFPALSDSPIFGDTPGKMREGTIFDLASAATGLMVFDAIPLTITRPASSPNQIRISFPASAVGLTPNHGKLTGDVTLIALGFDRTGRLRDKDGRVVSLHLSPLPPGQVEDRSVQIATPLNMQSPVARVRVVIRSNANGKVGAANFYLVDPATLKDQATGLKPRK